MTESADEIETRRAERDDLRADRDKLRGSLWGAYQMVCGAITDTYTYQSALPDAEAHEVDERLVPVRRAIGWDPYRNRACPAEAWAPMAQPSLEAVLGRHYEDNADKETLEVEVEELREAVSSAFTQAQEELSRIGDWMRSVAPEGTPYLGRATDEATRQDVIGAWLEAADVLGIEVIAPYSVETEDGPLHALALIVGRGRPKGTLLFDLNDYFECDPKITDRGYWTMGLPPSRYRRFDRAVFEEIVRDLERMERRQDPVALLVGYSEPLCAVTQQEGAYVPELHADTQDTDCAAWRRLLELIDEAAEDGRAEFAPKYEMPRSFWNQIVTLPPSIAKLTRVKHLRLYGSNLVALPPEIGQMTNLEVFTPYTSRRLHWFPYEITRCTALRASTVSTRHLYGNFKFRMPFPGLPAAVPSHSRPARCSVCDGPLPASAIQVWISLRVATDTLPLLVHACSEACVRALPHPPPGYLDRPHQGGPALVQPGASDL